MLKIFQVFSLVSAILILSGCCDFDSQRYYEPTDVNMTQINSRLSN